MKRVLSILLIIFCATIIKAQNYPVQVTTQILPPYSVFLSDYASIGNEKLIANVYCKDVTQSNLQVKLKLTIKGNGITIVTRSEYQPIPILLTGGEMRRIACIDLESYLDAANLDFYGYSKSEFIKTGKIPEGMYQFSVEVYEATRNVLISNKSTAIAWLILNEPPRFVLPQNNLKIEATNPQNIMFTWMALHMASPNSAFTTEYEFTMVEVWPENRNPNEAILTSVPFYRTTTTATSLLFGPGEPPMEPGRKYVCRLKAYDTEGRDMFKNNGYSEMLVFTFGDECKEPTNVRHDVVNQYSARIYWDGDANTDEYQIRYRIVSNSNNNPWYTEVANNTITRLDELTPDNTYEYQVVAVCGQVSSDYSDLNEFTLESDTSSVECMDFSEIPEIDGSPPIASLNVGDVINCGGFEFKLLKVTGGNGVFSGNAVVKLVIMDNIKVQCAFTNIEVNESYQVTKGAINVEGADAYILPDDTRKKITETLEEVEQVWDKVDEYIDQANDIVNQANDILEQADELKEEAKNLIENGKEIVEEGIVMITEESNIPSGQELIEQGKETIQKGIDVATGVLSGDISLPNLDKLREYVEAVLSELSSLNFSKNDSLKTEYEAKKKAKETLESTINTTQTPDDAEMGEAPSLVESIDTDNEDVEDITDELEEYKKDADLKAYFDLMDAYYAVVNNWTEIYITYLIVEKYRKPENIMNLVNEIKEDGKDIVMDMLLMAVQGKGDKELKKYIKDYILNKLEAEKQELLKQLDE